MTTEAHRQRPGQTAVHPFLVAVEACKEGLRSSNVKRRLDAIKGLDDYLHGRVYVKSSSECNDRCHMEDGFCVPDPITD